MITDELLKFLYLRTKIISLLLTLSKFYKFTESMKSYNFCKLDDFNSILRIVA